MRGQGRDGGRHAAPTGAARRRAQLGRGGVGRARAASDPDDEVAIIGGAVLPLLSGRIRRQHTSADVETPTTELALTRVWPWPGPDLPPPDAIADDAADPLSDPGPAGLPRSAGDGLRPYPEVRRGRGRRVPVIAAVVGIVLAAVATAGAVASTRSDPPPVATVPPTVLQRTVPPTTSASSSQERAAAYLNALRSADIPASRTGQSETEAAVAICEQSRRGVPDAELARLLPAMLVAVDRSRARTVVNVARHYYCP